MKKINKAGPHNLIIFLVLFIVLIIVMGFIFNVFGFKYEEKIVAEHTCLEICSKNSMLIYPSVYKTGYSDICEGEVWRCGCLNEKPFKLKGENRVSRKAILIEPLPYIWLRSKTKTYSTHTFQEFYKILKEGCGTDKSFTNTGREVTLWSENGEIPIIIEDGYLSDLDKKQIECLKEYANDYDRGVWIYIYEGNIIDNKDGNVIKECNR